MFPDVVIDYGDNKIGVFDVKYKHFRLEGKDKGVNRKDRFQLITYLASYSSVYEVVNSGFVYPCKAQDYDNLLNTVSKKDQFNDVGEKRIPFNIFFYKVNDNYGLQRIYDQEFSDEFYNAQQIEELIII